jgi:hypothetical protein
LTKAPFVPGQFVWCKFPYSEAPLLPGDKERIVYIADVRQRADRRIFTVMSLYTTTVPWEPGSPLPLGVVPVTGVAAAKMNQKSLVIDARRIAFVPATDDFFPRLGSPERGIIYEATKGFRAHIENILAQLAGRADLIQVLGPEKPGRRKP